MAKLKTANDDASYLARVKIGSTTYNLKDSKLVTLLGGEEQYKALSTALGDAAWKAVETTVANDANLPTGAAVQSYVATEIGKIVLIKYEVVENLPEASADVEFNKTRTIYLKKEGTTGSDVYGEYICVNTGTTAAPVYAWEKLGDTRIDLSGFVTDVKYVDADHKLQQKKGTDGTYADVHTFGALADKSSASGSFTPAGTISEVDATPAGTVTVNELTQTATAATLTKAAYTPAGSITGSAISGGSIDVTLKQTATDVDLTRGDYTPEGTVSVTLENATIAEITSVGTLAEYTPEEVSGGKATVVDTTKFNGGSAATWTGKSYTAPSFTEGAFTAASYDAGFLSAGAQASFTQGAKASLTDQSTASFAKKVLKPAIDSGDDECLVFNWVDADGAGESTAFGNAVTDRGTFTANGDDSFTANTLQTLDATKFHGGEKAADTFGAGALEWGTFNGGEAASLGTGFVTAGTDVSYTASTYTAATLPTKANKTVGVASTGFTGTKETGLKVTDAKFDKASIDTKTFTPTAATLGFSGTEVADFQVTGVSYDKATANGASFAGTTNKITPTFSGTADTVTVE